MSVFSICFTAPSVIVALAFFLTIYFIREKRVGRLPPGPRPLPLLGNTLSLIGRDLRQVFREYRKIYGDIFTVHFFNKIVIVICGYENLKDVFVKRGSEFSERPPLSHFDKYLGLVFASGDQWKSNRRFVLRTLKDFGMGKNKLQAKIQEEIACFLSYIDQHEGQPFNIKDALYMSISNVICSIILGERFEYTDRKFLNYIRASDEVINANLSMKPHWLKYVPWDLFGVKKALKKVDFLLSFQRAKVREHMETFDENTTRDVIDAYIEEMWAQDDSTAMNEDKLIWILTDLFIAGSDTTATAIAWCLVFLLNYPECSKNLKNELCKVVDNDRLPNTDDRKQLPLLQATIFETLRRANIAPLSVPHSPIGDTEYHGYTIPKSSFLIPYIDSVLMDDTLWQEPSHFDPSRFLNKDGTVNKINELTPFSLGPRMCLGESLAMMEMFLFISAMLQRFEFLPPDGETPPSMDSKFLGRVCSPEPFKIRAIRRKE